MQGCEAALADHLAAVLDAGGTPDLEAARAAVAPPAPASAPTVSVPAPGPRRLRRTAAMPPGRGRVSDVDAAKLPVMLTALRLPTIGRIWQEFGARGRPRGLGQRALPRRALRA